MKTYRYMIVGGGLAGGRACDGIRKLDSEGTVALVAGEHHRPYQRPPLSKAYLTSREDLSQVYLKEPAAYTEDRIDLITGLAAAHLDPGSRRVTLADGQVLGYETLLLATGARAWRLPIPGSDLPGVHVLRTIEDADAIRGAAQPGIQVVVLGGSFIGSEVAASLAQLGLQVTMVFPNQRLLERVVPPELSAHLAATYSKHGIRIVPGSKPARLDGGDRVARMLLESGDSLDAELVVMGVGVRLNTDLAREAGLKMDERGAVLVDEYLRTSDPSIYAAGDIAAWPDATFRTRLRVEHWDVARGQGLRAGRNMAGEGKPYQSLPYFFSDLFDLSLEAWGDLTTWDQTVLRGSLTGGGFAFYYFDAGRLTGVLAAGRPDSERKPMQALVRARPSYADVADRLPDDTIDLAALTGPAAPTG